MITAIASTKGRPLLKVELVSVTARGKAYDVQTDPVEREGDSRGKNTAKKIGGGTVVGWLLGGLLGREAGAAIGAAVGAGAGAFDQGLSHAKRVRISSEERLEFSLRNSLTVQMPVSRSTTP